MVVIDVNDWPSFAVVRDVAGGKIARPRRGGGEACRRPSPSMSGMAATSGVGATYKAREVEETLDVWFYRPLGYQIARAASRLSLTPNAVTAMGGLLGILAGHLFLYRGWVPAAWGIALLVTSEAFDSADGQLARLTGQYSKLGRILDGLASNLVFTSIYVHLAIRVAPEFGSLAAIGLILVAGVSHSMQMLRGRLLPERIPLPGRRRTRRTGRGRSGWRPPIAPSPGHATSGTSWRSACI